jgi:hypothetical protein
MSRAAHAAANVRAIKDLLPMGHLTAGPNKTIGRIKSAARFSRMKYSISAQYLIMAGRLKWLFAFNIPPSDKTLLVFRQEGVHCVVTKLF